MVRLISHLVGGLHVNKLPRPHNAHENMKRKLTDFANDRPVTTLAGDQGKNTREHIKSINNQVSV